jgi:hypothetical protein
MTIDPQHTPLANELEEIRWARTEAHVHLCVDTSSHGEGERRAIVFCPARCDTSVDRRYLILQKPAEQVDMMGREIKKRAAPGPSSSFPFRHHLGGDRLAERGLDGANVANSSAPEQCPGTLVRRMVAIIESNRRDDLRLRDDVNNGASLTCRDGQWFLDVHVLAGASCCNSQFGVEPIGSANHHRIDIIEQQIAELVVNGTAHDRCRERSGGWVGIGRRRKRDAFELL